MAPPRISMARVLLGLAVALVCVVAFTFLTGWLRQVTGLEGEGVPDLAFAGLVVLVVGSAVAWNRLAQSAFSEARLEVLGPVTPDGRLSARLVLDPKRPLTLVAGKSSVLVFTRKEVGDDVSRVYEDRQPLPVPAQLLHRHEQRIELVLRPGLPPTSAGKQGASLFAPEKFESELQVTLALEWWPDLVLSTPVHVPAAADAAPATESTDAAR